MTSHATPPIVAIGLFIPAMFGVWPLMLLTVGFTLLVVGFLRFVLEPEQDPEYRPLSKRNRTRPGK